jgi:hypothetical protein
MRVRLFSMLLMFAILFGGLVAPETAHADNLLAGHSVEVLDKHDHADDGNQEDPGQKGGCPGPSSLRRSAGYRL